MLKNLMVMLSSESRKPWEMWRQSFFATSFLFPLSPLTGLMHFSHQLVRLDLCKDVRHLLRAFLSNFIRPELLAATSDAMIHEFDYENISF